MIASSIPITHPNKTSVPHVQMTMLTIESIAQMACNLKDINFIHFIFKYLKILAAKTSTTNKESRTDCLES
jgi:hypothetical protein